jgi:DNA-binding MarR family transcriptional regulator
MNKAVQLVAAWGEFDREHPKGSLEDFCRNYLRQRQAASNNENASRHSSETGGTDFALMRLNGRIYKLLSIYAQTAADGTGINTIDEFSLLNAIQGLKNPKKTEAIYTSLFELSTGTDMLTRLKKIGYISESADQEDKRSKRITLTPKGQKALLACRKRIEKMAEMIFHDMTEEDKRRSIQLLSVVDSKFEKLWLDHKGLSFDEIYSDVM